MNINMNIINLDHNITTLKSALIFSKAANQEIMISYCIKELKLVMFDIRAGHPESPNSVSGGKFEHGRIIAHTHLNNTPPSNRDLITMIFTTAINQTAFHIVISDTHIYAYYPTPRLVKRVRQIFEECGISHSNNTKHVYEFKHIYLKQWMELIKNLIRRTNIRKNNQEEWIRGLKSIGIIMNVFDYV